MGHCVLRLWTASTPLFMGISIGGADFGFWFAQQGSIFTFLALISFYAWRMNKLDDEFGLED